MANWERKSSYLLREIVKFRTYIDTLHGADATKQRIYAERSLADMTNLNSQSSAKSQSQSRSRSRGRDRDHSQTRDAERQEQMPMQIQT